MIKNYLKITFRNLWRHRGFSFLNILGLTVGMTAFFLIFSYVKFELGYDAFHPTSDRVYRIVADIKTPTETINASGPAFAVPPNAKNDFPEIEDMARVLNDDLLLKRGDLKFQEDNAIIADSGFFKVFGYKLLKGNPQTALREPFNLVLSETAVKKYFGKEDPIGKTLEVTGDRETAIVTGVIADMPENSIIKADVIMSMTTISQRFNRGIDSQWGNYGAQAFLLMKANANAKQLEKKFPAFLEKHNGSEMKAYQMYPTLFLEKLPDVYLRSTRGDNKTPVINSVFIFSAVGIFILLIAAINFINLTTARSTERAKEVGIRKVVGAERKQLMMQFIGESIIICLIAFLLTVGLAAVLLPMFNQLAGKEISGTILDQPQNLGILFGTSILIGGLAGIYPALVLSSFRPVSVLKGRFATGNRGVLLRKGLVVSQFAISIALIIGTIVVYTQMKYMRSQELGFKKDEVLVINTMGDPAKNSFRQSLASLPGVKSTAWSGSVPGGGNPGAYSKIENNKGDMQVANLDLYFVDFDFIPAYNVKVIAGRAFSGDHKTDTTGAMILNEAAVKMFGFQKPADAIGKKFDQWGRQGQIIGVIKDFHFRSLQEAIKPLSMRIEPDAWNMLSVNLAGNQIQSTMKAIEDKWKSLVAGKPFTYFFLDEFYDEQYRREDRFGKLFFNFAILAIVISCLGLLGLASYSTMQRTKEIGIRKVMGASVTGVVHLLSKDFLKLVLIAFVIAAPTAWYFMNSWLGDFAYRIKLEWWIFVLAGVLAVVVAAGTISFQAIRAALTNPVKSLRTE